VSRDRFWVVLALLAGGVFLLPAALVGALALVNGLVTGNGQLVRAGAVMGGVALLLGAQLWWLVRRVRGRGGDSGDGAAGAR